MKKNKFKQEHILKMNTTDQYRTVDELFKRSQPNSVYYTMLVLSAFIVTAGLLLNNAPIVIGGMLVTPVLTPLLVIALGLATGEIAAIKGTALLTLKSFVIIVAAAVLLTFIFGPTKVEPIIGDSLRTIVLYFIVALTSGVAATFAWTRKEIADVLPGIAIAVSLVPPLGLVGIGISTLNVAMMRFNFLLFLFNLLGIIVGSLVIFSLLKFYRSDKKVKADSEELKEMTEKK